MAQPIVERASRTLALDDSSSDLMPDKAPHRHDDQAVEAIQDIIIRSKVRAPVLRDSTLPRARLLEWMDQHADDRVRMLVAEAGYGKTTLLADWARRTIRPVRWVKLDPSDAEWAAFISYVVAAFQEGREDFGNATLRLLGHVATLGVTRDQATGQLLAELGGIITEPTVLIIDDVQHVAGNEDIAHIIGRLLERAPQQLTFLLSGRGTPELKLGRLTAQGSVVSLTTEDLRFTRTELGDLFSIGYRMPLEADLLGMVDARTEGWAASLQLLHSSLRGQRKAEIREFIKTLRGTKRPLYDFLAEEVLGHQTPFMQQMLLHASVAERVIPEWVTAAMSVLPDPPDLETVADAVLTADELGLMSRNSPGSSSRRFHPLLREFLREHLARSTPPETLRQIHLKVAKIAEEEHWPTAAHHYIEGAEGAEAMRVIGDASVQALGTGSWEAAVSLVERMPGIEPSAAVTVLVARSMARRGQSEQALSMLEKRLEGASAASKDRALLHYSIANTLARTSRHHEVDTALERVLLEPEAPYTLRALARAWRDMLVPGDSARLIESMTLLLPILQAENLHFFAGLASHNLSLTRLARGEMDLALRDAEAAMHAFDLADGDDGNRASTLMVIAHVLFDMGRFDESLAKASEAIQLPQAQPDVFAEAAMLFIWTGQLDKATSLIREGAEVLRSANHEFSVEQTLRLASASLKVAQGEFDEALRLATGILVGPQDQNLVAFNSTLKSVISVASGGSDASTEASEEALRAVEARSAHRWRPVVAHLRDIAVGDTGAVVSFYTAPDKHFETVLLIAADALPRALLSLETPPPLVLRHVTKWAERWRPTLRRGLSNAGSGAGYALAALLAAIGDSRDVAVIQDWEKRQRKWLRDGRYSEDLARRISPTLVIQDLGETALKLGSRSVPITGVRKRAATLLLFLVSRPRQTATRDQVLDALWPDLDPVAAGNSLHQTLFFLRRELVVEAKASKPMVEYVPVAGDLIRLVPELVHVDSVSFLRQAADVVARNPAGTEALKLVQSYGGPFAPEFEYEEWAIPWREHVHTAFLNLAEQAARARMSSRPAEAAAILRHAIGVDPVAVDLKPLLAAAMYLSGSQAAARHLYKQYEAEYDRDFGEPPVSFQAVLADFDGPRGVRT